MTELLCEKHGDRQSCGWALVKSYLLDMSYRRYDYLVTDLEGGCAITKQIGALYNARAPLFFIGCHVRASRVRGLE